MCTDIARVDVNTLANDDLPTAVHDAWHGSSVRATNCPVTNLWESLIVMDIEPCRGLLPGLPQPHACCLEDVCLSSTSTTCLIYLWTLCELWSFRLSTHNSAVTPSNTCIECYCHRRPLGLARGVRRRAFRPGSAQGKVALPPRHGSLQDQLITSCREALVPVSPA